MSKRPRVMLPAIDRPKAAALAAEKAQPIARPEQRRPWRIEDKAGEQSAELWLYDEIGGWGVWASEFVQDLAAISAPQITVRISSPGGDVFDGIAIANALMEHPAQVTVRVDGLAASIASVIAIAGDRVVMGRSTQMMIHNASTLAYGDARDIRQTADLLDKISGVIAQAYADRTGTPVEDWQAAMDAETWFTADECVTKGLADEVAAFPARIKPAPDEDDTDEQDDEPTAHAAARTLLRPAAHLEDQGTAPTDVPMPNEVRDTGLESLRHAPVRDAVDDAPTEDTDEPLPDHPDAAVLAQALAWWTAIDTQADAACARIAATLGVDNPDVDTPTEPVPLPAGPAGLAMILGMLTAVDTIVDGGQVVMARACGVDNPDPDADPDDDDEPDDDDAPETSTRPAVAATEDTPVTALAISQPTSTPGTGATADPDIWAALTTHLTTPPTADDVFAALRGALL